MFHIQSCLFSLSQLDQQYNEFKLRSIMSEHKKTITAISWCPDNPDLIASASADNLLIVWNVAEKKAVARMDSAKGSCRSRSGFNQHSGLCEASKHLPVPQASPCPSAGAGTRLTGWRSSPSAALFTSGCIEVLILGSRCTKKPTPSYLTSASSGGTPPRRGSWCSDTQMEVCLCFSQVPAIVWQICTVFTSQRLFRICFRIQDGYRTCVQEAFDL